MDWIKEFRLWQVSEKGGRLPTHHEIDALIKENESLKVNKEPVLALVEACEGYSQLINGQPQDAIVQALAAFKKSAVGTN
jgi:hypothetical protein